MIEDRPVGKNVGDILIEGLRKGTFVLTDQPLSRRILKDRQAAALIVAVFLTLPAGLVLSLFIVFVILPLSRDHANLAMLALIGTLCISLLTFHRIVNKAIDLIQIYKATGIA